MAPQPSYEPSQPHQPWNATGGRRLLSTWTRRIAWMGVAAVGAFSFVAARSVPGHTTTSTTTPPAGSTGTSGSTAGTGVQGGLSSGSTLQPANQAPLTSGSAPFVRSGGS